MARRCAGHNSPNMHALHAKAQMLASVHIERMHRPTFCSSHLRRSSWSLETSWRCRQAQHIMQRWWGPRLSGLWTPRAIEMKRGGRDSGIVTARGSYSTIWTISVDRTAHSAGHTLKVHTRHSFHQSASVQESYRRQHCCCYASCSHRLRSSSSGSSSRGVPFLTCEAG